MASMRQVAIAAQLAAVELQTGSLAEYCRDDCFIARCH